MYRVGRVRLYLAIVVTLLIESTFLNLISAPNIRPDFMLIMVIFVGLHSDWKEALETGLVGGLLRGALSTGSVGINMVTLGLCGLFASYCRSKVFKDNFLTQIILTLVMALAINVLAVFTKTTLKDVELAGAGLRYTFMPALFLLSIYTSIFAPPLFFCLRRLFGVRD